MLRLILLTASLMTTQAALAQDDPAGKPGGQAVADRLTVDEALTVLTGLSQLSKSEELDKDGHPIFYKFSAATRYLIANNIDIGRRASVVAQAAIAEIKARITGGAAELPKDKVEAFMTEAASVGTAQSKVGYYHIKVRDLCLEVREPECRVANDIPPSVLGMLWPILDK